jgi:UDP-N-acetylmuramoyl-tripeptide--D-alanyl-D-alanine ligase
MRPEHTVGIFEVGISKRGEMAQAVQMLKPTSAAITFIGHSHSEGLGSLADICFEKRQIFKLFKSESVGVINGDQPVIAHVGYQHPVIKFGSKSTNQIQARKIRVASDRTDFVLKIYKNKFNVSLNNPHDGAVYHALAAAALAMLLHIDCQTIVQGISMPIAVGGRFQQLPLAAGNGTVIHDAYNASPESVKAALLAVENIKTDAYKVAILGDMLELGVDSMFWHRQVGRFLRKTPSIQEVVLVGAQIKAAQQLMPPTIKCSMVDTIDQAIALIKSKKQELLVLVKGSRGMALERVVDSLAQPKLAASKKDAASFAAAKRLADNDLKANGDTKRVHA